MQVIHVHVHDALGLALLDDIVHALQVAADGKDGVGAGAFAIATHIPAAMQFVRAQPRDGGAVQIHAIHIVLVHEPRMPSTMKSTHEEFWQVMKPVCGSRPGMRRA